MSKVAIRAYTRRNRKGKTIRVRNYSRRIGRKGVLSPKRNKQTRKPGEELEKVAIDKKVTPKKDIPDFTPEELAKRMEVMEGFKRAEAERVALGMSREVYSRYKTKEQNKRNNKTTNKITSSNSRNSGSPLSAKRSLGILENVENKIAKFVEKYSGKQYKRQL